MQHRKCHQGQLKDVQKEMLDGEYNMDVGVFREIDLDLDIKFNPFSQFIHTLEEI